MSQDAVYAIYAAHLLRVKRAMTAHLPRLRQLAQGCARAIEFGTKSGASASALLLGAEEVISYDIVPDPACDMLLRAAAGRWTYVIEDSRQAPVLPCDLLLLDSLHTYEQVAAELARHGDAVRQYLVFHDTLTFGSIGADGESGRWRWEPVVGQSVPLDALGIRPAIDEWMISRPIWRIAASYADSHGLLVLERKW